MKPDLGVYLANYCYPAPLQFSRFLQSPLRMLSNPRIVAGFVFGGGLNV
jgi:hypothetical protein